MAGITPDAAREQRDLWLGASTALAAGQSYAIGSRTVTRADAEEVRRMLSYWNRVVDNLDLVNAGIRDPRATVATFR